MSTGIKLQGFKEMERLLDKLPGRLDRRVIRGALTKTAKPLVKAVKAKVPVFTGNLKKSIGAFSLKHGKGRNRSTVAIAVGARTSGKFKGYHAHLVEFGTVKMKARPFLRPAFDRHKGRWFRAVGREIWNGIRKEINKLRK